MTAFGRGNTVQLETQAKKTCMHSAPTVRLSQLCALSSVPRRVAKQAAQDQVIYLPLEDVFAVWQCSPDKFRISYANKDFTLCSSYPEVAIVPKTVSDEDLKKV